jgi:hypothetical protein
LSFVAALAYYGMQVMSLSFRGTTARDYVSWTAIDVVTQDVSRVVLNLGNNSCSSVHQECTESDG